MAYTARAPGVGIRAPHAKLIVFGIVVAGLFGLLMLAVTQESVPRQAATPAAIVADQPVRRVLTRDEEAYAEALWPIHNEVKLAATGLASGSIQVALNGMTHDEFRPRVEQAQVTFAQAEDHATHLRVPPSIADLHAQYLKAITLYRQSTDELARMFVDGDEEHMRAAGKPRLDADKILREVGYVLWPNEYVPS